jgi:MurNAc alpha-1-phosphate uridylyltransferase
MKAMIFAAGFGTRFKPWTDKHPKALALVNGRSLLERNVTYLQQYGITELIINVHHFAEQIIQAIDTHKGWGSSITISDETGAILETGGGLKKAGWYFDKEPFVVINVDILTDLNLQWMINAHLKTGPLATLAVTSRNTSRYFLFDQDNTLCGWRNIKTGEEKPDGLVPDLIQKAFSGVHVIDPRIFPLMPQTGRFSIVDSYLELSKTQIIMGFDHSESKLVDVGKPQSVIEAEKLFP